MKVIQFPKKESTSIVEISYEPPNGKSYYQQLKEVDEDGAQELLSGILSLFEFACKNRLEEIEGNKS